MEHFTLPKAKKTYRTNFSIKNLLGEHEVSIRDLYDPIFAFIEEIFRKRKWKKLTKGIPIPYIEIVREFYANCESFDLDDKSITFKERDQTLTLFPYIIRDFYDLPKVSILSFPYKEIGTPSKT
jgi:hypothetical protein